MYKLIAGSLFFFGLMFFGVGFLGLIGVVFNNAGLEILLIAVISVAIAVPFVAGARLLWKKKE